MLPGDEGAPIELVGLVSVDTIDETLFWIPSTRTLIAGDIRLQPPAAHLACGFVNDCPYFILDRRIKTD